MEIRTQFDDSLETAWSRAIAREPIAYPFLTFPWHAHWFRQFGADERLIIMADPEHDVLLPLSIRGSTSHFTGGEEIADYLDAVGNQEQKAAAWQSALPILSQHGARELILRNVPAASATLEFFRGQTSASVTEEDTTPTLLLPDTFDAYLAGLPRKDRHEMRRKIRRFEELNPDARLGIQDPPDMQLLLTLMRNNGEKDEFLTTAMETFFRGLPDATGNALIQSTLTHGADPIATTVAFAVNRSLLLYNSGYEPRVEGSGWYMKAKLIEWAIHHGYRDINFLQGNERYKYDLGATDVFVYRISLPL